ncbi:endo-1,4-beta-xylanase [Dysgonomonas sp. PFB1-18]|uniref:endo-1,4-beta-xylanase n=1 Tax=unclassified Dysgonomonas TaxID=2630389 RepID=UPI0024742F0F|nr:MULTISPECIES: endo-1,4-beta-xylanase [unclassified Dysgonomonas]MDH6309931.1 endo-1,4-beta-xylanase [Dysgonomonas sp. PF1-14]MDH6339474.1 endo-1,4-beta-xylanase [Dysgonomonas sp. PF1-16]MDH6380975.1 endo-1,4-beta-xylanase [Dysgonomonas sp. PFB1-18]MDH6397984.1 endo-1,4-beta-xylanase [Dysgonomonas sp. PF1-23]
MKNLIYLSLFSFCLMVAIAGCSQAKAGDEKKEPTLTGALNGKFYIGTALNLNQIHGKDSASIDIVKKQFDAIVAENCMKSMFLQPKEGEFFFDDADKFVEFGEKNNMFITGHCLIWHSQAPGWFFTDDKGKNVSPEILKARMKTHITTVVSRYKGRIKGWDVVNEAIMEDGSYRKSKFYEILGEEFIPLAFQYAHEADPDTELYYNDYNEWHVGKRETIVKMVKSLKERGIRIDGVGMQGHIAMDGPSLEEYQAAVDAYANAGVKAMITEFELSALPSPRKNVGANISEIETYRQEMNPYTNGLPDSVATAWTERMASFFKLFLKNKEKISRVTLWGVTDKDSWKNNFPMYGRTDYPLLFDRQHEAKPVVQQIIDLANNMVETENSKKN